MSGTISNQIPEVAAGETRNAKVDFSSLLDSGELLTGTPTVTEVTTSDLTIANEALNSSTVTMFGKDIAANKVVQFSFSGHQTKTKYFLDITVATDSTPAQTFKRRISFRVR